MDDANAAGITSAIVAGIVTLLVTGIISPPWGFGTVLLGVSIATYATGYVVATQR
ncbi:hypothetical protein RYH80_19100 [Halobaculum sp. MBLA0147]|uniref:hypothetical protein n=1 Tax=Halobaculum sp. MBLA0147 TaxID=3079934 RepID=UPI003523191F